MKILKPFTFTDGMLTSSSVAEDATALWNAATNYTAGTIVRRPNHHLYENIVAGVDATPPEDATGGSTPRWLDLGIVNRWAMFDDLINTKTTGPDLTVVIHPGMVINALALVGLAGGFVTLTIKDSPGGTQIYQKTVNIATRYIASWTEYLTTPWSIVDAVVFDDVPLAIDAEYTIYVDGANASIGVCKFGAVKNHGDTLYGVKLGIENYTRVTIDPDFGTVEVKKRNFAKVYEGKAIIPNNRLASIYNDLSTLAGTPCVWIPTTDPQFSALIIYGLYRDFSIDVQYYDNSYCTLSIQGMV